jgi:type IV pilus assembly protein PilC
MEYVCKVGTPSGEVVEQTFNATDEAALRADLEQKGYYLFTIRRGLALAGVSMRKARIPGSLLMIFAQELAALLKAGLPLLQSLDVMLDRQRNLLFKRSLTDVREKVKSGMALSEAFRAEGRIYPPILAASLVAGERSGNLEVVLRRFSQYVRLNQSLKKKAISASVYPLMLMVMMLGMSTFLIVGVIPKFQEFYSGLNTELPFITRSLMAVGTTASANLHWILLGLVAVVLVVTAWLRRESSGVIVDGLLLRVPIVGHMMRIFATSQLARTLSSLLAGGLPLLHAMEVSAASVGNRAMGKALTAATPLVREGKSLTVALESTQMFDNLPLEMVKVGEQTGALGDMLTSVADFYDEELETRIATALALVEPIMLVLMAVIVAVMLLAFYLPLFEAIGALQQ